MSALVEKHIVAMGGGGFSMEPDNSLLDQYILGWVNKAQPKVCFLPTAGGDSDRFFIHGKSFTNWSINGR